MASPVRIPGQGTGRFRVGDRVLSPRAFPGCVGEIVEDRGPIGHQGRYYYHVVFVDPDLGEEMRLDWPEESMIPLDAPAKG